MEDILVQGYQEHHRGELQPYGFAASDGSVGGLIAMLRYTQANDYRYRQPAFGVIAHFFLSKNESVIL